MGVADGPEAHSWGCLLLGSFSGPPPLQASLCTLLPPSCPSSPHCRARPGGGGVGRGSAITISHLSQNLIPCRGQWPHCSPSESLSHKDLVLGTSLSSPPLSQAKPYPEISSLGPAAQRTQPQRCWQRDPGACTGHFGLCCPPGRQPCLPSGARPFVTHTLGPAPLIS